MDTINLYFSDYIYEYWISREYNINLSLLLLVSGSMEDFFCNKKLEKETSVAKGKK